MLNTRERLLEWKLFDAKSEIRQWSAGRPTAHMLFASREIYEAKLTKAGREVLQVNVARQCGPAAEIF